MNRYRLSLRASLLILSIVVPVAGFARAQTAPTSADLEEAKLEQEFTDPLTTLSQVVIRDSYTPSNYGTNLQTNQLVLSPLIPRIPPHTLLPFNTRQQGQPCGPFNINQYSHISMRETRRPVAGMWLESMVPDLSTSPQLPDTTLMEAM